MGLPGSAPEGSGENMEWGSIFAIKQGTDNVIFIGVLRNSHGCSG